MGGGAIIPPLSELAGLGQKIYVQAEGGMAISLITTPGLIRQILGVKAMNQWGFINPCLYTEVA